MSFFKVDRASVRHIGTEEAFAGLGLSKRAVASLIRAGVLSPRALAEAPWSDEEAKARFISLQWRLSVDPDCGPKVVREIERCRTDLLVPAS
jgi:hypothetical protein